MQDLALFVFPHLEYHRVQPVSHLTNGAVLLGDVGPLVEPVRALEQFPGFFKSDATLWVRSQVAALADIEAEPHKYNCYTTLDYATSLGWLNLLIPFRNS